MNTFLFEIPARVAIRIVLIGAIVSAAIACGKKEETTAGPAEPATAAAAPVKACELMTQEEAATALGEAVAAPAEQVISRGGEGLAAISQCMTQATASPGKSLTVFVRVSPVPDNNPDAVRQTLTESGVQVQDVSGVGNAAFWGASGLYVFVDPNLHLIVTVRGLDDSQALAQAREAALRAIERAT